MGAEHALAVFKAAPELHSSLEIVWPELFAALVARPGADAPSEVTCVIGHHGGGLIGPRPLAVGRIGRNGQPACRRHLEELAGGDVWPLRHLEMGEGAWASAPS